MVDIELVWEGSGMEEMARNAETGNLVIQIDPQLYRHVKHDCIVGDPSRVKRELGFVPQHSFTQIIREIVMTDLKRLRESGQ